MWYNMRMLKLNGELIKWINLKPFNNVEFKKLFNEEFIKDKSSDVCEINFFFNEKQVRFLCGYRGNTKVFVNTETKKEYSTKEFELELDKIQNFLNN